MVPGRGKPLTNALKPHLRTRFIWCLCLARLTLLNATLVVLFDSSCCCRCCRYCRCCRCCRCCHCRCRCRCCCLLDFLCQNACVTVLTNVCGLTPSLLLLSDASPSYLSLVSHMNIQCHFSIIVVCMFINTHFSTYRNIASIISYFSDPCARPTWT